MKKVITMSRKPVLKNQDGALLIGLIITMVIIAIAGAAAMQLTTGSSLTELFQNNSLKAFYLAESGARYAAPLCNTVLQSNPSTTCPDQNNKTFTLSPGQGQFTLTTDNTNTAYLLLTSVGTLNPGSWSQTKRTVTYELVKPFNTPFNDPNDFDQNWNHPANALIATNNGPANGGALMFKGSPVSISLNWHKVPPASSYPDLLAQWLAQGNLLSYDLQVKCKDIPTGSNDSYMLGLLFRLDNTTHKSYGISFYRRDLVKGAPGFWPATLSNVSGGFNGLGAGKTYLVLWMETLISTNPTFSLLAYKDMTPPITDVTTAPNYMTDWSTIMVRVTEQAGGNLINGYVVANNTYAAGTVNWDNMNATNIVTWNTNTTGVVTNALTSANFDNRLPAEIGLVGYNGGNSASNKLFFADFAMRFPNDTGLNGTNGSYATYGTYVQYY
jgi:hypothetical protein